VGGGGGEEAGAALPGVGSVLRARAAPRAWAGRTGHSVLRGSEWEREREREGRGAVCVWGAGWAGVVGVHCIW
jgi:hypothetical protein